uniref:Uncharacterized protein n=1 Tax=Anguilla anguilla TaxID=7936 RepID=A0A0E9XM62_ANGAN
MQSSKYIYMKFTCTPTILTFNFKIHFSPSISRLISVSFVTTKNVRSVSRFLWHLL